MNNEVVYLLLIFALLVIPRALQRFRIPAPLTSLLFGVAAVLVWGERTHDQTLAILAMLGISSLFLFAGLEVNLRALRRGFWPLIVHLVIRCIGLGALGWLIWRYIGNVQIFGMPDGISWQAAGLLALALLTPSTGFIIDTLGRLGLTEDECFWVTNKAIAAELLALVALFVLLQANDLPRMAISSGILIALIIALPVLFIVLDRWVVPQAPGAEFSLLVMAGMIAAYITHQLDVHYLLGAFIAGVVARLLQQRMPQLASIDNLNALRLFASFFVPFYFFRAGTNIPEDALSFEALGLGIVITVVMLPLRIGILWLQRRMISKEKSSSSLRVSVAMSPTLIFTLVLAGILLQAPFHIPGVLFGGLLLYAVLNTLLPSLVFRMPFDVDPIDNTPKESIHPEDCIGDNCPPPKATTPAITVKSPDDLVSVPAQASPDR